LTCNLLSIRKIAARIAPPGIHRVNRSAFAPGYVADVVRAILDLE
jgi:hypothetical protein